MKSLRISLIALVCLVASAVKCVDTAKSELPTPEVFVLRKTINDTIGLPNACPAEFIQLMLDKGLVQPQDVIDHAYFRHSIKWGSKETANCAYTLISIAQNFEKQNNPNKSQFSTDMKMVCIKTDL